MLKMAFTSGSIAFSALASYYGKSLPVNLNQMYRGIPEVYNTPINSGIPTSGTIKFSEFRTSYHYPFDITTIMTQANNLVNSFSNNILMPPYSNSDHFAGFYWNGSAWIAYEQDSYGSGDNYFNTMRNIFPSFFTFFATITGGTIPVGSSSANSMAVGTKYSSSQGWSVNGTSHYGYGTGQSENQTFDYLNAILHNMSGTFGNLQNVLNGINFAGNRTQFISGMQNYVNYLYAN